jgi:hypothetical protein
VRPLALTGLGAAAVALGGCGSWLERPFAGLRGPGDTDGRTTFVRRFEPPIPCGAGPYPSRYAGPRRDSLDIGPLRFRGLAFRYGPDRFAPGAPALTVPVDVPAHARVVISVPPETLGVAGLDTNPQPVSTPAEAHRAVRCFTGEFDQVHSVSFVVDGPRCVPVSVTMRGATTTRNVPFGVRRCRG